MNYNFLHPGSEPLKLYVELVIYLRLCWCNYPQLVTRRRACPPGVSSHKSAVPLLFGEETSFSSAPRSSWSVGWMQGILKVQFSIRFWISGLFCFQMLVNQSEMQLHYYYTSIHPWKTRKHTHTHNLHTLTQLFLHIFPKWKPLSYSWAD